jgi:FkbM family methyltransferase
MKTLIEVGACDGTDSLSYHAKGYRVYTFEPKKDLYDNLVEKTRHLSDYHVFPKAVCLSDGKTTFNICKQGGASSILKFRTDEELNNTWTSGRTDIHYSGESYEVETTRLDSFIEEYKLQDTGIDFIHIDAQGVDLECLMSLGKYIVNVKEGVVETVIDNNKSIYVDQKLNNFENVKNFLEENNFMITSVQSNDYTNCEYNIYFRSMLANII